MRNELAARCSLIEECYEFMLAYAAQGVSGDEGSGKAGQVRDFLERAARALTGLSDAFTSLVRQEGLEPAARYHSFLAVLDRDAKDSLAAIELVLVQPAISSQLIDNLNASIHLRALLTDLFLIDEIMKLQSGTVEPAKASS
jgi:hypothetical protein